MRNDWREDMRDILTIPLTIHLQGTGMAGWPNASSTSSSNGILMGFQPRNKMLVDAVATCLITLPLRCGLVCELPRRAMA